MNTEKETSFYQRVIVRKLRRNFIAGLLVLVPVVAAIWLLAWTFIAVDNLLQPLIRYVFDRPLPGLGFAVFLVIIYVTGLVTSNILGRRLFSFTDKFLDKVPVFRQVYIGAKQVVQSISGAGLNKSAFREVVFVAFPRDGMMVPAFVTNKFNTSSGKVLYAIYIPTTPVPTSGFFEVVSEDQVVKTDISVDSALKMIISAGMLLPPETDIGELLESRLPESGRHLPGI